MSDTSNYRDYVTDGKIGIDLTATYPSMSAGSTTVSPYKPGDRTTGNNNSHYVFARAQSDITQFQLVGFSSYADSSLSSDSARAPILACAPISVTLAVPAGVFGSAAILGIAQISIASSYYGWIALSGTALRCNAVAGANPKVALYCSTTGGAVTSTTASSAYIAGLTLNTSATSASAPWCYANFPKIVMAQTSST
jgi:hypothetical protein